MLFAVLCAWLAVAIRRASTSTLGVLVSSQTEWPEVLRELLEHAVQKHINVDQLQVYCISKGWDDEYYWQMKSSPQLLDLMNARWTLSRVDAKHAMVRRFWERLPTNWDSLSQDADPEFFMSASWLAGEKGNLYLVMHDKARGILVVRYYYNF
jgi:hypothetical protein